VKHDSSAHALPGRITSAPPRRRLRALPAVRRDAAPPSSAMYLGVFAAWALAVAWFHPRLVSLLDLAGSPLGWGALAFFVAFTEVAWLYAFFNLGVVAFALRDRWLTARAPARPAALPANPPAVAVLYTTCNDFVEASAASCLVQDYPRYTVYLLDDSSDPAFKARVDAFAAAHPGKVRVVRRPDRRAFKAGNLNHALAGIATEPFFALVDADEVLPTDFLARTVPHLLADPTCGFVQANHRASPRPTTAFAASLGQGIDVHWRWYQPLRNRYGFVMLLGHGAVLRREAWEAIGGFPEIVSEDLGFALRIREQGWRGYFAEDVVCEEDFPETVRAFRVRHMKWTRGTCEFLSREMGRALRSPRIPLVEKLDVLFPTLNLPLALLYFLFVLDANLLLVALYSEPRALTVVLGGAEWALPVRLLDARFGAIMGPDFWAMTLLTLVAPILVFVIDMWRTPVRLLKFLAHATATYGTLGPLSSIGVLLYAATGRAVFHVTADRGGAAAETARAPLLERVRSGWRKLLAGSHPDHLAVQGFELACGLGFAALSVWTFQVSFFGLALGFALLPLAHRVGWDAWPVRALLTLPFAFVLLGVALGGLSLFGLQTVMFGMGFHF